MSRIGQKPIPVPSAVEVGIDGNVVSAKSSRGTMQVEVKPCIAVNLDDCVLTVRRNDEDRQTRVFQGLYRSLINNMIVGLSSGFIKELEIIGVGYRANASNTKINLQVGYTHPVEIEAPEGVTVETPQPTQILVKGYDKQAVGQFAANIRRIRPPEPYKGKGIRYKNEYVRRKVGKAAVGSE